eukprot:577563-Pyramimonas_sp.AAC.2
MTFYRSVRSTHAAFGNRTFARTSHRHLGEGHHQKTCTDCGGEEGGTQYGLCSRACCEFGSTCIQCWCLRELTDRSENNTCELSQHVPDGRKPCRGCERK